ncbi:hydrogenase maturation protease [Cyanobium sp. Morenito 9A2]|uniref:hydrogenase maturation protease n=1 Tax=Cyanobium sp. Morenito 9A2 TaxID=2823718 RepID=UPI0020CB71DC|nr:hydrogenase maturation protease [Cyanobium sp. Morenito 9A2]MCP9848830.1 hydrogenase maturation protease [Cyanobium sp. Morenito 9A2]
MVELVIGIGNRLRSDDGVGPRLAEEVEAWGLSGVESMAVPQLTPELAPRLAACARVLFIDAWLVDGVDASAAAAPLLESLEALELSAAPPSRFSHHSTPQALLQLAEGLYGQRPEAWWLRVPAHGLELGEQLSPATAAQLVPARRALRCWLDRDA